jgi:RHS repeat-associated protein
MRATFRIAVVLSLVAIVSLLLAATPDRAHAQCVNGAASISPCNPSPVSVASGATGLTRVMSFSLTPFVSGKSITSISCTPSGIITSCSMSASFAAMILNPTQVTVTYNVSLTPGTGAVVVRGTVNGLLVSSTLAMTSNPPPTYTVQVTPDGQAMGVDVGVAATAPFTVHNFGNATATYALTSGCTGMVGPCSVSPSSVTLTAGQSTTATLSFTPSPTWTTPPSITGTAGVTATYAGFATDAGSYSVSFHAYAVSVTPDSQALLVVHNTSQTALFTVKNNGNTSTAFAIVANCSGVAVTGCHVAPGTLTLSAGQSGTDTLSFVSGPTNTTGSAGITASFDTASDNGSYAVASHTFSVSVSPVASTVVTPASTTRTANFNVTNTGDAQVAFVMTTSCVSPSLASCSAPSPVTIGAGLTATVPVTYTTSATNTVSGPLSLTASFSTATSTGSMTVTTPTPVPMAAVANVSSVNPGEQVARDLCLTVAAGNDAAYECGDLRLVHPFATVRTKNKARTPTLLYTSEHAQPFALVAVSVSQSDSSSKPDSVNVNMALTDGSGRHPAVGTWGATSQWAPGVTRRLTLGFDAATYASGVYPYTLTVTNYFGATTKTTLVSGTLLIVNRKTSPFGAGWWLAGLEQLTPINGDLLWVGGDGSARVYHAVVSGSKWGAAAVDRPDTITFSAGMYTRIAEHGVRVQFNSAGQHVSTTNRLGDVTTFAYTSGRLTTITVPPSSAAASYTLTYGNPNTTLSSVQLTAGTATRITSVANPTGTTISSFTDPDTTTVGLTYVSGTARVQTRTDRRLHVTTYNYDVGGKLSQVSVAMASPAPSIVTKFRALESLGLPGQPSATPTNSYSLLNGPRDDVNDVGDSTRMFLDRFGAPQRIFNALGDSTVLVRADARFPALVTQLRRVNGFTSTAAYDARGNLQLSTDLSPIRSGVDVTSSFKWDTLWDFVARIDRSGGLPSDTMSYDAHGNRLWQQAGPDATRRVTFTYDPTTLLVASVQTALQADSGATVAQHFTYNAAGNGDLATSTSPGGLVTHVYSDVYGRDTLIKSPLDLAQTQMREDSTIYDAADRVIRAVSFGPARNGQPDERTVLVTHYDPEGNVVSTSRSELPDTLAKIGTMQESFVYDFAHRKVKAIAVDGLADSMIYDPAGNVDTTITRRGLRIAMTYDALNRLSRQVSPAVTYPKVIELGDYRKPFPQYSNDSGGGLGLSADTAAFTYDVSGNLLHAANYAALIRRGYLPNGLLASDTEVVRNYTASPTVWGDTVQHRYILDYVYDDAGRRTSLLHPTVFSTGTRYSTTYGYDPVMGQLKSITDPLGNVFTFTEDADGRPVRTQYPGGVRDTTLYNLEGSVAELVTLNTATRGPMFFSVDTLYRTVLTREGQGRVTSTTQGGLATEPPSSMAYGGLGELVTSNAVNLFFVFDFIAGQSYPAKSTDANAFTLDALGNQVWSSRNSSMDAVLLASQVHEADSNFTTIYTYDSLGTALGQGRLRQRSGPGNDERSVLTYDAAGNIVRDSTSVKGPQGGSILDLTSTHSYYDAQNKLRVVNRQYGQGGGGNQTSSFDEYAYDALGRRVLVRSRIDCGESTAENEVDGRCKSNVRRTVWDGDAELWEIQGPGDSTIEDDAPSSTTNPRLWGKVLYLHGQAVDEPLGLVRFGYQDKNSTEEPLYAPGPFLMALHYSWRGRALFPTFADGSDIMCASGSTANCVQTGWTPIDAYYGRMYTAQWPEWSWLGTLLEGKTEAGTGLQYKRNRYYDPQTGRFTQEDPIGLAGGLNAYGFAGGDPINFSDPFGLCRQGTKEVPCKTLNEAGRKAIRASNPRSIKENREYAGEIVKTGNGEYYYTTAKKGTTAGSQTDPNVPGYAADYHTHGADSKGVYDDEHFSPADKQTNDQSGKPGFLGTPSGKVLRYDPDPNNKQQGPVTDVTKP